MTAGGEDGSEIVIEVHSASHFTASTSPTAEQRHNMAVQHFLGAAHFCRSVARIEHDNLGKGVGGFFEEILWNFSACVMLTVSCLEASLNETMDDSGFDKELAELISRKEIMARYNLYLKMNGKMQLDKGKQPAQDVKGIIKLRNALVHFGPVWDDDKDEYRSLENVMPRLQESPFFGSDSVFFPRRCITRSYAEWSVSSAYDFIEEFCDLAGATFRLKGCRPIFG